MADKDEEWIGPITEASKPLGERLETLEAGEPPEDVTEAVPPIEERVARLERIAEYLHDARKEAVSLASSVDTLAEAARTLAALLIAIEGQQQRIEHLGDRVDASEATTIDFRDRVVRRAVSTGIALIIVLAVLVAAMLAYRNDREEAAVRLCLARNEQADITADTFREVLRVIPEDSPSRAAISHGLDRFEKAIVPCGAP